MEEVHHYIDRISPVSNTVVVDWSMGSRCNYHCSYCPTGLHDGKSDWATLDQIKGFFDKLEDHYETNFQFIMHGGEPTMMPHLPQVCEEIKRRDPTNMVALITNGSRTLRWWKKNKHLFNCINLTAHPEHCDPDHLVDVCLEYYRPGENELNVLVTMNPDFWDRDLEVAHKLTRHSNGYSVTLKQLRIRFGTELYPYSKEQLEFFKKYGLLNEYSDEYTTALPTPEGQDLDHDVYWKDGRITRMNANKILNQRKNKFTGMKCYTGIDKIFVNKNHVVKAGSWCRNSETVFGYVTDPENIKLPTQPMVCQQPLCMNVTDMRTRKHW
jgi:hypothetical protein